MRMWNLESLTMRIPHPKKQLTLNNLKKYTTHLFQLYSVFSQFLTTSQRDVVLRLTYWTLMCQTSTGLDVWQVVRRVLYLRPGKLR
jgi:hypothetical protein